MLLVTLTYSFGHVNTLFIIIFLVFLTEMTEEAPVIMVNSDEKPA